jgi:tetratricopeptide (TPR) repeat protein
MDAARRARGQALKPLILLAICVSLLLCTSPCCLAQAQTLDQVRRLADAERWAQVIAIAGPAAKQSADLDFYYGTALARIGRLEDARNAFAIGIKLWPRDERFPVELAGVAFRQKRYSEAGRELHRALKLDPSDSYASDFLGTVYFLQGNLPAALKYWNRVSKPLIASVEEDPIPKVDPALLDKAFTFSPASTLLLPELRTTELRVRGLGIFPSFRFDLEAKPDGKFDVAFRNWEKNGLGGNKWIALLLLLRGLPAQSVYPEYFNLHHEALNLNSFFRWDAQKRRLQFNFSGPVRRNPREHFVAGLDLRHENWQIRPSFTGPAPLLGAFNLRREAGSVSYTALMSGRWHCSVAAEFSHRDFRSVVAGTAATPALLAQGNQLKETMRIDSTLWADPDRRISLDGSASAQTGRIWSTPAHAFEKLQGSALLRWFPRPTGDDYETTERLSAGKTFGDVPFDELWMLGIGGDNDLWMRGHIATRDGRKGVAPLGRNYFLSNWELDKNVHDFQIVKLKAGPLIDTGTIRDPIAGLGSHKWLCDVGGQIKATAFGFGVALSYGKDLRSGNNAVYVSILP